MACLSNNILIYQFCLFKDDNAFSIGAANAGTERSTRTHFFTMNSAIASFIQNYDVTLS